MKKWLSLTNGNIIFLAILVIIPVAMIIATDYTGKVSEKENKTLVVLPDVFLTNERFPPKMDNYINDRIGFKHILINIGAISQIQNNDSQYLYKDGAIKGFDSWLFYNDHASGENVYDFIKTNTIPDEDLLVLKKFFENINNWSKEQGIKLIILPAPNKHNIYPEFYSLIFNQLDKPSNYQNICNMMADSEVIVLCVDAALREVKNNNKNLYYKQDTHWNFYGAEVAYRELAKTVNGNGGRMYDIPEDEFSVHIEDQFLEGDMMRYIIYDSQIRDFDKRDSVHFKNDYGLQVLEHNMVEGKRPFTKKESAHSDYSSFFVVHDSFFDHIEPYFDRSVRGSIKKFEWSLNPLSFADEIVAAKPDFLIWEMQERFLPLIIAAQKKQSKQ